MRVPSVRKSAERALIHVKGALAPLRPRCAASDAMAREGSCGRNTTSRMRSHVCDMAWLSNEVRLGAASGRVASIGS